MRKYSEILKEKFYGKGWAHPYKIFEKKIFDHVQTNAVILDVGCGKTAPVLNKFVDSGSCFEGLKYLRGWILATLKKRGECF